MCVEHSNLIFIKCAEKIASIRHSWPWKVIKYIDVRMLHDQKFSHFFHAKTNVYGQSFVVFNLPAPIK